MAASITRAGERLIAEKQAAREVLQVVRFVLAFVPGLSDAQPVDRDAGIPPDEQIVYRQPVTQAGFINPNQVAYSLMMGSDIGDFDWNWIGLQTEEGVLLSVAYVPLQQKRKNRPPVQIGNNVTRNFLVVFEGAQELADVTIDASTWQHDFTVRLQGIDQRECLANVDLFGPAVFYGMSFQLRYNNEHHQIEPGLGYVSGIRLEAAQALQVAPPSYPCRLWLEVALERQLNDVVAVWKLVWADELPVSANTKHTTNHYALIADLGSATEITDRRNVLDANGALVDHFAARVGDYERLRARATTKADVGLDQIPNAISDDPGSNSSMIVASTAALNRLGQIIADTMTGMIAPFAMNTSPDGWLKCNGAQVSRITYANLYAAIGTTYGAGDGTDTFQLPDLRGLFLRAWDDGRGIDAGRAFGSTQTGLMESHSHNAALSASGAHAHVGNTDVAGSHAHPGITDATGHHGHSGVTQGAGAHAHTTNTLGNNNGYTPGWAAAGGAAEFAAAAIAPVGDHAHHLAIDGAGEHAHNLSVYPAGEHAHGLLINPVADHSHHLSIEHAGGAENRPINAALLYCIKY